MQALSEEEKRLRILKSLNHLNLVQSERAHYNSIVSLCAEILVLNPQALGPHPPCSFNGKMHYNHLIMHNRSIYLIAHNKWDPCFF
jgi:hypothetical protein